MALYRCAACGSPNVVSDIQKGGIQYNYVKGAVGTVILGAGGAVAGISNETQTVYKCPDCGLTLTYPMLPELKMAIDIGVASADARANLTFEGCQLPWEMLVKNYKNIESGYGDEQIKVRAEQVAEKAKNEEAYLKELTAIIIQKQQEPQVAEDVAEQQKLWELLNKDKLETMQAEIEAVKKAAEEAIAKAGEEALEQRKAEMDELTALLEKLNAERADLQAQHSKLGFFSMGAKKEIQAKIEAVDVQLREAVKKAQEDYPPEKNREFILNAKKAEADKFSAIIDEIRNKYSLPESPMERVERKQKWERIKAQYRKEAAEGSSVVARDTARVYVMLMTISEFDDAFTYEQFQYLLNSCFGEELSIQRVSAYTRRLEGDVFIRNDDNTFSAKI